MGKDEEDSFDSTSCDEVHYPKWISNSAEDCLSQVWSTIRREQHCRPTRPDPTQTDAYPTKIAWPPGGLGRQCFLERNLSDWVGLNWFLNKTRVQTKPRGTSTVPAPATVLGKWEVLLREMLEIILPSSQEPVFCDRQLSLHKCAPQAAFVTRAFQLLSTEVTSSLKAPN